MYIALGSYPLFCQETYGLKLFFPCAFLLKNYGILGVTFVTLGCLSAASLSIWWADTATSVALLLFLLYLMLGFAFTAHQQLRDIRTIIEHIDTRNFDHRNIHFQCVGESSVLVELMGSYKELGHLNTEHSDRNKEVEYAALQVIDISSKVKLNVQAQADSTISTASAVTEMSHSLDKVSGQIKQTNESALLA